MTRVLATLEMFICYLLFPGLLLSLFYFRRNPQFWLVIAVAVFFLTILSFVTPNVGSLYRYRYAYEFLLLLVALVGWVQLFRNYLAKVNSNFSGTEKKEGAPVEAPQIKKLRMLASATMVSVLTLAGYLGFFARDVMMVRWFGAGSEMDAFLLGTMIPMFLVALVAMPAGTAAMPVYAKLRGSSAPLQASRFINAVMLSLVGVVGIFSICLYLMGPALFALIGKSMSAEKLAAVSSVMNIYLIIMVLGSLIIMANTVLNAMERIVYPAVAQMVVPVIVIFSILVYGEEHGIYAAIYGMLVGQLVNFGMVVRVLWRENLLDSLRLEINDTIKLFPAKQYSVLMAAALAAAIAVPTANILAADMPEGSVTIIGLGMKVILLITGVVGMGLTTVLLPHFSILAADGHHEKARMDLSLFLLLATFVTVPVALALRMLVGPVAAALMSGGAMNTEGVIELIRTVQYGVAQLPFFVCGLIVTKYVTALQRSGAILGASVASLALMLFLGKEFSQTMGVSGIALAISIGMAASAICLLWYASWTGHVPRSYAGLMMLNWMVFVAMYIGLHFHYLFELAMSMVFFVLINIKGWSSVVAHWRGKTRILQDA